MSTGTQVAKLLQKRQAKLERQIEKAEGSIQSWKDEIRALSSVVASLRALGGAPAPRGPRRKARGKKRGSWKPGRPGRPPQWYRDQQAAKGASSAPRKGRRRKRRAAKPAAAPAS